MLDHSIIIALAILAGHSFTWDEQIFSFVRKLINEDKKISKPIYSCPICMSPWWGTIIWLIFWKSDIRDWFLTIAPATGMSVISVILIYAKDYFKSRTPKKGCC